MNLNRFGHKGTLLARKRFTFLLNYLIRAGIKNDIKGTIQKKVGYSKKLSLINWVEFNLQPTSLSRIYKILLVYIEGYPPYVYVLTPSLEELKNEDCIIPHLYDHKRYRLCLYYPHSNDYSSDEEIGQQYIPWITHWLYYFEEWLYSGEWKGGGVEPGDIVDRELNPKYKKKEDTLSLKDKETDVIVTAADEANKIYDRRLMQLLKELKNEAA